MSEIEMNSYRFSSGIEPSDEMLAQLMREVAEEVRAENEKATAEHLAKMRLDIEKKQKLWGDRIKSLAHAN
jgi:hypothetical protein